MTIAMLRMRSLAPMIVALAGALDAHPARAQSGYGTQPGDYGSSSTAQYPAQPAPQAGAQPPPGQAPPQQYGGQSAYGQPQQQYGGQPAYGQPQQQYGGQPAYGQPQQQYGGPPPRVYADEGRDPDGRYRYREREDPQGGRPRGDEDPGSEGSKIPPFSIRLDPLTWLIEGKLGPELEVGITKWMTGELVPIFVTSESPPSLNVSGSWLSYSSRDDVITQHSNGLGPISGTSLGLGFWLGGEAFRGYVLRAIFTNYGYEYRTPADAHVHTERVLMGMIGSMSRLGIFTLGWGLGIGSDLNNEKRCYDAAGNVSGSGCGGIELKLSNTTPANVVDIGGWLYPVVINTRLSLGITID